MISDKLTLSGGFWDFIDGLDFELLGYAIVGTFILSWIGSIIFYWVSGVEKKYGHLGVDVFTQTQDPQEDL